MRRRGQAARLAVQREPPAFRLDDGQAERIPVGFFREIVGARFRRVVGEQQSVGNFRPASKGKVLLTETGRPAESFEHRPNEVLLGLGLVRRPARRERVEDAADFSVEPVHGIVAEVPPFLRFRDGVGQEVFGEQAAAKGFRHDLALPAPILADASAINPLALETTLTKLCVSPRWTIRSSARRSAP